MSNLGLHVAMRERGIRVVTTPVGDRYVVEEMVRGGYNLGGEQSGHIVFLDHNTTGDGSSRRSRCWRSSREGDAALRARRVMRRFPQVLLNVPVAARRTSTRCRRAGRASQLAKARSASAAACWSATPAPSRCSASWSRASARPRSAASPRRSRAARRELGERGGRRRQDGPHAGAARRQRRPRRDPAPGARRRLPGSGRGGALAEAAGADGITVICARTGATSRSATSRRSRRLRVPLNLEMAVTDAMVAFALRVRPRAPALVPERREELTTEGGLDVAGTPPASRRRPASAAARHPREPLRRPDPAQLRRPRTGGAAVELHTGDYANARDAAGGASSTRLGAPRRTRRRARPRGHAGHGLTVANVGPVAALPEIVELNIGTASSRARCSSAWPRRCAEMKAAMAAPP
jgi:pyridoxine 5-phosphate synthase